jgi:hypothetical protein
VIADFHPYQYPDSLTTAISFCDFLMLERCWGSCSPSWMSIQLIHRLKRFVEWTHFRGDYEWTVIAVTAWSYLTDHVRIGSRSVIIQWWSAHNEDQWLIWSIGMHWKFWCSGVGREIPDFECLFIGQIVLIHLKRSVEWIHCRGNCKRTVLAISLPRRNFTSSDLRNVKCHMTYISQPLHISMCHLKTETDHIVPGLLRLVAAILMGELATSKKWTIILEGDNQIWLRSRFFFLNSE